MYWLQFIEKVIFALFSTVTSTLTESKKPETTSRYVHLYRIVLFYYDKFKWSSLTLPFPDITGSRGPTVESGKKDVPLFFYIKTEHLDNKIPPSTNTNIH